MQSKILITGASGGIGGFLVTEALEQNFDVYAAVRTTSNRQYLQDPRINFCNINLSDKDSLIKLMDDHNFDVVLHNAGITKASNKEEYTKVNANFTKNIAEASIECQNPVKRFIYTSSLASYGPADFSKDGIINNKMKNHPVTWYGESKLEAEKILMGMADLPYLIFRPTGVFGPRDMEFLPIFNTIKKGIAPQIGFTKQNLSLIYVKDLAKLFIDAAGSKQQRKGYFVSDGNDYSSTYFNEMIAQSLNINTIKLPIPITILKFAGYLSEMSSKVTKKYPMLNSQKVNELKARNWRCDVSDLIEDFGFSPKYSLKEGIEETITWYKSHGLL